MIIERSKEWWLAKAGLEGDISVVAGRVIGNINRTNKFFEQLYAFVRNLCTVCLLPLADLLVLFGFHTFPEWIYDQHKESVDILLGVH